MGCSVRLLVADCAVYWRYREGAFLAPNLLLQVLMVYQPLLGSE